MSQDNRKWMLLLSLNLFLFTAAWFFRTSEAAPPNAPFANSVEQSGEMIQLLKKSNALLTAQNLLLTKQNSLLESGQLQVQIVEKKK
ncbi:MAG: hypothetical protein COA78_03350 [Blastopirellula sp.]|nr:MAG: hypothetical protein COA78_03350 [Blastopirellula sp.]